MRRFYVTVEVTTSPDPVLPPLCLRQSSPHHLRVNNLLSMVTSSGSQYCVTRMLARLETAHHRYPPPGGARKARGWTLTA